MEPHLPIHRFLANVAVLEYDALPCYQRARDAALAAGDAELETFFSGLAELTRLEADDAQARNATREPATLTPHPPKAYTGPLRSAIQAGSPALLSLHQAVSDSLELKRRSHGYYASVRSLATDRELRLMAQSFAEEAAAHLKTLEDWITRLTA